MVQPKRHKSVLKGNVAPPRVKPTQNKSIKSGRSQVVAPKVVPPVKQILSRPTRIPPEQLPPELAKKVSDIHFIILETGTLHFILSFT